MIRQDGRGPREAERGARAFLDEALAMSEPGADYRREVAALDALLADSTKSRALFHGPRAAGRSALLARWAGAVAERGDVKVAHVPISRAHGVALDREVLGLLCARLAPPRLRPLGVGEMRATIGDLLDGGREEDEGPLLLIIDGAEETIGFHLDASLLGRIGPGVRVVVAAEGEPRTWVSQLGWSEEETWILTLARVSGEVTAVTAAPREPDLLERAHSLLRVLSPAERADLERLLPASGDPIDPMILCSSAWLGAWMTRPDACLGFLSDVEAARACAAHVTLESDGQARSIALGDQARSALIEVSVRTLASAARREAEALASDLGDEGALRPDALPPLGEDTIDLRRILDDRAERAEALAALAAQLPEDARDDLVDWAYEAIRGTRTAYTDAALISVLACASSTRREAIARETASGLGDTASDVHLALDIAPFLPAEEGASVLRVAFDRANTLADDLDTIGEHAARLPDRHADDVWRWAAGLPEPACSVLRARIAPCLSHAIVSAGLEAALAGLCDLSASGGDYHAVSCALAVLAPHLAPASFDRALATARAVGAPLVSCADSRSAMIPFILRLATLGRTTEALETAAALNLQHDRWRARAALLSVLAGHERDQLAGEQVLELERADRGARSALLEDGIAGLARGIDGRRLADIACSTERLRPIAVVAAHLAGAERRALVEVAVEMARRLPEHDAEALFVMPRLARDMSGAEAAELFGRLLAYLVINERSSFLAHWNGDDFRILAPLLHQGGGDAAVVGAARAIVEVAARFP